MDWVDRPQIVKGLYGIFQLLQGSHLDNCPLKTLKLDWVTFHSVTVQLKCVDFQSNQWKNLPQSSHASAMGYGWWVEGNSWNIVNFVKMSNIYNSSSNWTDNSNWCKSWIRFYSIMWSDKFNASATACITSASAHVPWCVIYKLKQFLNDEWSVLLSMDLTTGLFLSHVLSSWPVL